jgi:hypothetical protein
MGGVSSGTGRSAPSIPPETSKTNQRWLYDYRVFLEGHEELEVDTIDEHLRALARMSFHFGHRPFEKIVIRDVLAFKSAMREACDPVDGEALSRSTLIHTLQRCGAFYSWLSKSADSEATRTQIPIHCGQHSDDCGQLMMTC